jgi:hypothetical protein
VVVVGGWFYEDGDLWMRLSMPSGGLSGAVTNVSHVFVFACETLNLC